MKGKKIYFIITAAMLALLAVLITLAVVLSAPLVTGTLSDLVSDKEVVKIECLKRYGEPSDEKKIYELDESKWEDFFEKTRNTEYRKINDAIKSQGQYKYTVYYQNGTEISFDLFRCYDSGENELTNFRSSVVEDRYFELFAV